MRNVFGSDVDNVVNGRNVYPELSGMTTGTRGSAMTGDTASRGPYVAGRFSASTAGANVPGGAGNPDSSGGGGDRKSTRLNSSHSSISYAVFCLKKKKKADK